MVPPCGVLLVPPDGRPRCRFPTERSFAIPNWQPSRRGAPGGQSLRATSGRAFSTTPGAPGWVNHTKGSPPPAEQRRDPCAVRVAFTVDESDEAVEWIIGRDLLIDGLKGPVGEGDVRIWPAGERDRGAVYIVLKPPDSAALLEVPAQDIKRFLQETETLVPRGSESEHIESDALLRHLLAEG
ncbi:SsgA family sporulation/cell division regulator [Streptomyces sp. NPDC097610]|uniref:SsgA family sporulation/cell division regulator n=1 Tax=Streptomyces sp. NPDC097610 TaxID=3157227 RepID=UPI00332B2779